MSEENRALRVLVVGDQGASAEMLRALAGDRAHHIETAADPQGVLEMLAGGGQQYDGIIADAQSASCFARLLEETKRRVEELEALRHTSVAVTSSHEPDTLPAAIIRQAVELLHARGGGVYRYDTARDEMVAVCDGERAACDAPPARGKGGLAWELVRDGHDYRIAVGPRGMMLAADGRGASAPLRAVLAVPLRWRGERIGVAYVEDDPGREFTPEDARLLGLFADQTAITLGNAELSARDERKLQSLEKLAAATREIMSDLGSTPLDARLTLIAKHAADILEAEVCHVHLVQRPGVLSLVASHGHREGSFHKGKEFIIHSGNKTGLIGHIAHEGKLFNEHGERLRRHFAVRGERPPHLPSGECHSMVAYPLKRAGGHEELIGLLCAENKKGADGRPVSSLEFTAADEWILKVFGEAVVAALDSASLIDQLSKQKEHLDRLVRSSPTGIITTDEQAHITLVNDRAAHILGYTPGELVGTPAAALYEREGTAEEVKRALDESRDEMVTNHETSVLPKSGAPVPIRQSSTRLYDAAGRHLSTVHYVEDLRSIRGAERRLRCLLRANHIVSRARDLIDGLQSLAEMLGALLPHTYCRILFVDESDDFMSVKAAYPPPRAAGGAEDGSRVINFDDWPGLRGWLNVGQARLLDWANESDRHVLAKLARLRGAEGHIRSLLLVPLRHENKALGMLEFGGLMSERPHAFTQEEIEFAVAMAENNINLIDRIRLLDSLRQREHLLMKLNEASLHIRAAREPGKLLQEIVRLSVELVGCNIGGIYLNIGGLQMLERCAVYGMPEARASERLAYHDGIIGHTAYTGKSYVLGGRPGDTGLGFHMPGLRACAAIPLKNEASEVEAVLFVASDEAGKRLTAVDIEMLDRFAAQAVIALQTSHLVTREQRDLERLSVLHKISRYIQASKDFGKTLHVLLTGVTAGYGLRLNRAAIFFLEGQERFLVGKLAIGHFEEKLAREDWARDQEYGVNDFGHYLEMLEQDAVPETPLGKRIKGLRIPLEDGAADLFAAALRGRTPQRVGQEDWHRLSEGFVEAFDPADTLAVVPLEVADQKLGLLVADNRFTHASITDEDLDVLHTFANAAATAVHNSKLLEEHRAERERLHALFQASKVWSLSHDPRHVLRELIGQPPLADDAASVRVILIDKAGRPWDWISARPGERFTIRDYIRPGGISLDVMASNEPFPIEDTGLMRDRVNPILLREKVKAALCLPFALHGKPIGVVWINYHQPRTFHPYEVEAIQLYVNHAAVAYDNARRMDELRGLHEVAKAMTMAFNHGGRGQGGLTTVEHVHQTIVEKACEIFGAASSTLWPYDHGQQKFLPDELRAVGIPEADLRAYRHEEPDPRGTTVTVLKRGWVPVDDTADEQYEFIRPEMRALLQHSGVRSFQGVCLKVGEEPVGVLYVGYESPRPFSDTDRPGLENFATYAALSVKNARLVDQVLAAKRATEVVAQESVLSDRDSSLQSVADATLKGVRCDAVVLYAYDEQKQAFSYPPIHAGVRYAARAWPGTRLPANSMVNDIIKKDGLVIVEDVTARDEFNRRFSREEEVKSCVAIPLRAGAGHEKVGVMFVNYRTQERFRAEEIANIQLFADQAAVALKNWQVFGQIERRRREQESLVRLSQGFLQTDEAGEMMRHAVRTAAEMLGVDFCNIVIPDRDGTLVIRAAYGWEQEMVDNFRVPPGTLSQTGYTIMTGEAVRVADYAEPEGRGFAVPQIVRDRGITSGLSVPLATRAAVYGAMLVHSKARRIFTDEDVNLLTLIANQTAIAIRSAERYRSLALRNGVMRALCDASRVLSESFGLKITQVLDQIVEQAVTGVASAGRARVVLGTLQRYDEQRHELVCVSVYASPRDPELLSRVGERRPLDPALAPHGKIGITGRALVERRPQLVHDVSTREEYVCYREGVRSELAVPLWDETNVIGVLNVESDELGGFDQHDELALEIFSGMAVTAIRKAKYIEELKREKGIVGARTALAWMGIASNMWWHDVGNMAADIVNNVQTLRLQEQALGALPPWADEYVQQINQQAQDILDLPITPPLSSEEGVADININELVAERLKQLSETDRCRGVELVALLAEGEDLVVRTSYAWMRFALDQLVNNGVKAVARLGPERRRVVVETRAEGSRARIVVTDSGEGMSDEVVSQIFLQQVRGKGKGEGLGIGLMIAEAIIEAYRGEISVKSTGPEGTCVEISLPRQVG